MKNKAKDMSILVFSCDAYEDCWKPFKKLYDKYFPNPYKLYIGTETKTCDFGTTIKTQGQWTNRLKETLSKIDTKYILFLLDDFFIRNNVDYNTLEAIKDLFEDNTATINFELANCIRLDNKSLGRFKKKSDNQPYLFSCQPGIWDREKLIEILENDKTPWQMETTVLDSPYEFYANMGNLIIDIGYYEHRKPWGIVQGKWATEMIELNKKEKLGIDFTKRGFYDIKLSILTPYYKTLDYTKKLAKVLEPQLNQYVEWIIVDDGCYEKELDKLKAKVIHKDNYGVSSARNRLINEASGQYLAWVDSDDLIVDNYVEKILQKIDKQDFDYCYLSWKNSNDVEFIIDDEPDSWNTCVWNCVYKKSAVNYHRFDVNIFYGEEIPFNQKVRKGIKANIKDIMYIYNMREESLTDLYSKQLIPKYRPIKSQIVMYLKFVSKIGGVETFLYEFFKRFSKEHEITFLYEEADPYQLQRYAEFVNCRLYKGEPVECDTYINVNRNKNIADNVKANFYIDMAHTVYSAMNWKTTNHEKTDINICVSEVGRQSLLQQFPKIKTEVIYNLLNIPENIKDRSKEFGDGLKLVSATRLSWEKGYDRMKLFAKRLNKLKVKFTWLVFTNDVPNEEIPGFIFKEPTYEVNDYVASADYYMVFSNTECNSMSNGSALGLGIPIISTNYPSIYEQGFVDGKTGYIVEMDLSNMDEVIKKMKNIPKFKPIIKDFSKQWEKYLGEKTTSSYEFGGGLMTETILDKWVALTMIRDDRDEQIPEGGEPYLASSERIRVLLDHNMIKRKDD